MPDSKDKSMNRKKWLNKELDDYLSKRAKQKYFKPRRKKRKKDVEDLEEIELEKADRTISKKGFWTRLNNTLFGTKATVEETPAQIDHKKPEKKGFIKGILYGSEQEEKPKQAEEQQSIQKVVLYKSKAEKDAKFLIKMVDSLTAQLGGLRKDRFKNSPEYKIFKKIKEKYA
ncbi:MAG: hypothetical protein MAG795_00943 [Candidatus Woesearchaeota archaeon]|nr:hypothetical protein [Candidatus Woesearchaeota archaeon]